MTMRCERFRATIPVSTCVARQKAKVGPTGGAVYLECSHCDQGRSVMEQLRAARRAPAIEAPAIEAPAVDGPAGKAPVGKRCPRCGRVLPAAAFNRAANKSDGLQTYCKECKNAWYAQRRASEGRPARGRMVGGPAQACPGSVDPGPRAEVVARETGQPASQDPGPAPEQIRVVTVSFEGLPDLFDRVAAVADREERTLEGQIRYWVRQAVEAMHGEGRG